MLTVDLKPFKAAVHKLIVEAQGPEPIMDRDAFIEEVVALAREHGVVISAEKFGGHIYKLAAARNADRARKLVDALDDSSLSAKGFLLRATMKVVFKYGLLAAFIIFVLWAYDNCGG